MIYKVYIGLVYEFTKDILHWQITLFIQENTPVIKNNVFPLHRFYQVTFYKAHSRFISLEIVSMMLPSKSKLFFDSSPFITHVIYSCTTKQGIMDFKVGSDFSLEFIQCISLASLFFFLTTFQKRKQEFSI